MVRLRPEDLDDPTSLAQLARTTCLSPDAFRARFGYLVAEEPTSVPRAAIA
jgi:6-phosphofructokinase 1